MRKGGMALACVLCALALAGTAAADLRVGVNDDGGKFEPGGSWFYPTMAATGLRLNAITLRWDELSPTAIADQPLIEQAIARAQSSGVAVELDIYPLHSQALTNGASCAPSSDPEACGNTVRIQQFAEYQAEHAAQSRNRFASRGKRADARRTDTFASQQRDELRFLRRRRLARENLAAALGGRGFGRHGLVGHASG